MVGVTVSQILSRSQMLFENYAMKIVKVTIDDFRPNLDQN